MAAQEIDSIQKFQNAVQLYNPNVGKFSSLENVINAMAVCEQKLFFTDVLPAIINVALEFQNLFPLGVPLLRQQSNRLISMSQQQASCLVANGFLCTFDLTTDAAVRHKCPAMNFNVLFSCGTKTAEEKIKSLINYLDTVCAVEG